MWKLIASMAAFTILPGMASAQLWEQHRGHGYVFFAPGGVSEGGATLHFGAGGEGFVFKGLAAGAELGYLLPARGFGQGVGLLSVNGSYHLNRQTHWRISPFVTGGYSLAFRSGIVNAVNFGGGLSYWFGERTGLRMELRDHVSPEYRDYHFLEFRIGLAFR